MILKCGNSDKQLFGNINIIATSFLQFKIETPWEQI